MVPQLLFLQISLLLLSWWFWINYFSFSRQYIFAACFCLNDDYSNCPNFWAIELEALLCSTANIKFPCSSSYSSVPCYRRLLPRQEEALSSAFVRQGRDTAIQAAGPALSIMSLLPLRHPIPPPWLLQSCGESYNIQSGTVHLKVPFQEAFRDSRGRMLVWVSPVSAQAQEPHTVFQTSAWKETRTWAYCVNFPTQVFLKQGNM